MTIKAHSGDFIDKKFKMNNDGQCNNMIVILFWIIATPGSSGSYVHNSLKSQGWRTRWQSDRIVILFWIYFLLNYMCVCICVRACVQTFSCIVQRTVLCNESMVLMLILSLCVKSTPSFLLLCVLPLAIYVKSYTDYICK